MLLDFSENVKPHNDPSEIFNTDQSGFADTIVYYCTILPYAIVHTNQTLSHTGEHSTIVTANAIGPPTHNYSIHPLLNMNGCLVGKLFVNLKQVANEFGPRVAEAFPDYPNLIVTSSKSGKLSKELV